MAGTSYGAPLVAGVAAMIASVTDLDASAIGALIRHTATDLTGWWRGADSHGIVDEMGRLDAAAALATALASEQNIDRRTWVYVVDSSSGAGQLIAQEFNATTLLFEPSTAHSLDLSVLGCTPSDVAADPQGDLVYVLCNGSPGSVLSFTHALDEDGDALDESLVKVGAYTLSAPADVSAGAELVVTQEGYLFVPSEDGTRGELSVLDTWDGVVVQKDVSLLASNVDTMRGGTANRAGTTLAFASANTTTSTVLSQVATVQVDGWSRSTSMLTVVSDPLAIVYHPYSARDVSWDPIDDASVTVFSGASSSDEEWAMVDSAGGLLTHGDAENVETPWAISINPTGNDSMAYVASTSPSAPYVSMVDITDYSSGDWYAGSWIALSSATGARFAQFADTGRFVVMGWRCTACTTQVFTLPHDAAYATSSSASTAPAVDLITARSGYDTLAVATPSPRAVAISPGISVVSPRPGKKLTGFRRLVVLVRDIGALRLSYQVDGVAVSSCPDDTSLADGISDTCVINATGWSSTAEHTVHVTAEFADATEVTWEYRY